MVNSEQLKAEIEQFKTEAMKMHIVQVWAESYKNSDPFGYVITEAVGVFWVKEQALQLWQFWQSAKQSPQAEIDSIKACRSDFEIIQQTIALVDLLATSTNVYQRDPSCLYPFESENPRVKEWWHTACKIQELLTNTDPENCDFDEYKKMIEAAQENSHE